MLNKIYPAENLNCHNRHKLRGKVALTISRLEYKCQAIYLQLIQHYTTIYISIIDLNTYLKYVNI